MELGRLLRGRTRKIHLKEMLKSSKTNEGGGQAGGVSFRKAARLSWRDYSGPD
jgi:hypothetical protein